jgi:hypothetical protein
MVHDVPAANVFFYGIRLSCNAYYIYCVRWLLPFLQRRNLSWRPSLITTNSAGSFRDLTLSRDHLLLPTFIYEAKPAHSLTTVLVSIQTQ